LAAFGHGRSFVRNARSSVTGDQLCTFTVGLSGDLITNADSITDTGSEIRTAMAL
jgi:hypothetical protein